MRDTSTVHPPASRRRRRSALALVALLGIAGCTAAPDPAPVPVATAAVEPRPSPSATPSPTPTGPADPLPAGPVTALLLGTDSRDPADYTGNADAIVIVQVSADRESLALISVTRDSWVTIPGHGDAKLNASFALGGAELTRATVSDLFGGLEFDYIAQTNFQGLIEIVDAVDGFLVDNSNPSTAIYTPGGEVGDTGIVYDFTADPMPLDDAEAILFLRQRYGLPLGDLDRTERTRQAIIGLLDRLHELAADPPALTRALVHIAGVVRITGELHVDDMIALTELSQSVERDDILSLMAPITGSTGRAGASVNVVDEVRTAALGDALRAGDVQSYVDVHGAGYP
ncbi:MAG: LCP family protein [Actinomycetota bacterium]